MSDVSLKDALEAAKLPLPPKINPTGFTRWGKNNRYWLVVHRYVHYFGDMVTGAKGRWDEKKRGSNSYETYTADTHYKGRDNLYVSQRTVGMEVQTLWDMLPAADPMHPYLRAKGIPPLEIRQHGNNLVIPLRDDWGMLWSIQKISPSGKKWLYKGGRKKGCFFVTGKIGQDGAAIFAEGYATAVTLHMLTGVPVFMTVDAGNMFSVIGCMRKYFPDRPLFIAADNDQWGDVNVGKLRAEEAAEAFDCTVMLPSFHHLQPPSGQTIEQLKPTDWNDLHTVAGHTELLRQLPPIISNFYKEKYHE